MTFTGKRSEILPWLVIAFIGAVLGRNICHHAGWPWWIGFTVVPALLLLVFAGIQALVQCRARRSPKEDRRD